MQVRIQKIIAGSGLASRRQAELLIRQGRVTVNGTVIYKLGTCVDPQVDHIKVNGEHIGTAEPEVFILMHKPAGYLTTMKDPHGRPTVADLVGRVQLRVFPVGRLDYDAEGLLLLTNNGQVAQACLHPKYHVSKTYLVKVSKVLTEEELMHLRQGVHLDDGITAPSVVKKSGKAQVNSWIEMTIFEGRTHQVKRMLEALGHRVLRLKRIRFGPLGLGNLLPGTIRFATDAEANALRAIVQRVPRSEKVSPTIMRTPGGPIKRENVQRPKPLHPSARPVHSAPPRMPKSRTRKNPPPSNTLRHVQPGQSDRTAQKNPGKFARPPVQTARRGGLERPKTKRPSFPQGVPPKVVLKAFMDYEKQVLEEQALRYPPRFKETPLSRERQPAGSQRPPSRVNQPKARVPRNSSGPRPASPKPSSGSTGRTRASGNRSVKVKKNRG